MKVLHIMNRLLPSGAEVMLEKASQVWDAGEMTILSTTQDMGPFAENLMKAGYSIAHIYDEIPLRQWKMVLNYIKTEKFDVVHIHRESLSYIYATICKIAGVKCIIRTVHNVFLLTGIKRLREIITRRYEKIIGVRYIAISKSVHDHELARFYNPTEIINNWYDKSKYKFVDADEKKRARMQLGVNNSTFCIVSVGNCSAIKNHKLIIEALGKVISKSSSIYDIRYYHIGYGPDEKEEKKLASSLGILDCIEFCGFTDPYIYLKAADLFIMPSVFEGVGISALEALAMGLPAILTDVYGLMDFKEIRSQSIQFIPLTSKALSDMIEDCLKHFHAGDMKNNLEQAERVAQIYDMRKSIEEYYRRYHLVI